MWGTTHVEDLTVPGALHPPGHPTWARQGLCSSPGPQDTLVLGPDESRPLVPQHTSLGPPGDRTLGPPGDTSPGPPGDTSLGPWGRVLKAELQEVMGGCVVLGSRGGASYIAWGRSGSMGGGGGGDLSYWGRKTIFRQDDHILYLENI